MNPLTAAQQELKILKWFSQRKKVTIPVMAVFCSGGLALTIFPIIRFVLRSQGPDKKILLRGEL